MCAPSIGLSAAQQEELRTVLSPSLFYTYASEAHNYLTPKGMFVITASLCCLIHEKL